MNPNLINTFELLLNNSHDISQERREKILAVCKEPSPKRQFINRKTALEILDISAPTLLKLIKAGKVNVYKLTPRKCRFDFEEIQSIANGNE